ncbi:ABC transporter substrate-binding protein [Mangrovibacillus cuniculi]|uniref:ABC transporter substrate-binding protein n=1 Tax=Mangrovibacillus cuniculi TaxID=2593652 RepID=UPI003084323A
MKKTIKLMVNNLDLYVTIAQEVKNNIEKFSPFKIELVTVDWAEYVERLNNKNYDIVISGWIGDFFDPYSMLYIWHSDSSYNYSGFSNKRYDELIRSSQNIDNYPTRYETLYKAEKIILDEICIIPLYHYRLPLLVQKHLVKKLLFSPLGIINFATMESQKEVLKFESRK